MPPTDDDLPGPLSLRALIEQARGLQLKEPAAARTQLLQARQIAEAETDRDAEAEVVYLLAANAVGLGQPFEGLRSSLEAAEIARQAGASLIEVWSHSLASRVLLDATNHRDSLVEARRAAELYRASGFRGDEGPLQLAIAEVLYKLGDSDEALVAYEAVLQANTDRDRPADDVAALARMAEIRADRKEFLLAVGLSESALALATDNTPAAVPGIETTFANSLIEVDDLNGAEAHLRAAYAAARVADSSPSTLVAIYMVESRWRTAKRQYDDTARVLHRAVEVAVNGGLTDELVSATRELALAYRRLGRFEEALHHQERVSSLAMQVMQRDHALSAQTVVIRRDFDESLHRVEVDRLRSVELEVAATTRAADIEQQFVGAMLRVVAQLDNRVPSRRGHSRRVGEWSALVARQLGEADEWCEQIRIAAQLHDIGAVGLSDDIIRHGEAGLEGVRNEWQSHTTKGSDLLGSSTSSIVRMAVDICQAHHERWDGSGFPRRLERAHIPLCARIVSAVDSFEKLVTSNDRPRADCVAYMVANADSSFDPRVVDALVRLSDQLV